MRLASSKNPPTEGRPPFRKGGAERPLLKKIVYFVFENPAKGVYAANAQFAELRLIVTGINEGTEPSPKWALMA